MNYKRVIQQYFGQSWEDVSEYETDSQGNHKEFHTDANGRKVSLIKHDLKEYRLTGYPTRVVSKRERD